MSQCVHEFHPATYGGEIVSELCRKCGEIRTQDSSYADVLDECARIARDREPKYGDASLNMKRIAAGSNLRRPWLNLAPHDVPYIFGVTKDERDFTFLQDDNPLDKACYAGIEVSTRRKGMVKPVHYVPPTWFNVEKVLIGEIIDELSSCQSERSKRLVEKLNFTLTDYVLFND